MKKFKLYDGDLLKKRHIYKWMLVILIPCLIAVAVTLVFGLNHLKNKHEEEINKVIHEHGGSVQKIIKVDPKDSPFFNDFNKSNPVYKIIYLLNGKEMVAWYRGVNAVDNIHADNPTALLGGFGEKWIFE